MAGTYKVPVSSCQRGPTMGCSAVPRHQLGEHRARAHERALGSDYIVLKPTPVGCMPLQVYLATKLAPEGMDLWCRSHVGTSYRRSRPLSINLGSFARSSRFRPHPRPVSTSLRPCAVEVVANLYALGSEPEEAVGKEMTVFERLVNMGAATSRGRSRGPWAVQRNVRVQISFFDL